MTETEARALRCSECSADGDDYHYDSEKNAFLSSCSTCPYAQTEKKSPNSVLRDKNKRLITQAER